jgi:CDP-diacylglycerol--glycerol-3-phosphate 3-phosphatidyltransferase
MPVSPALKQLPNAISIARLCTTPVLAGLAWAGLKGPFTWLLMAALLSDAADGYIARTFSVTSRVGALLDSVADAALMLAIGWGTWVFHPEVYLEHGLWVGVAVTLWIVEHIAALMRYGRFSSFHTALVRLAVLVFALFIAVLFLLDFYSWLFYLAAGLSILAVLEQLVMICLVPNWSPDLRGGLAEVLRRRRDGRTDRLD